MVTARPKKILAKALSCRVFGYQSHTEADIDSFLNFIHKIDLQVSSRVKRLPNEVFFVEVLLLLSVKKSYFK